MPAPRSDIGPTQPRKRRAHRKSRRGCRNCKLRRVKCDETQPACHKCSTFGVRCNYDHSTAPDLQLAYNGVAVGTISTVERQPVHSPSLPSLAGRGEIPRNPSPGMFYASDNGHSRIQLDPESTALLDRFHKRTVLSFGPPASAAFFQKEIAELACSHPHLMHMVRAITGIHDRHLSHSTSPTSQQMYSELLHISRAAALLSAKLSSHLQPEDPDPVWATSFLLTIAVTSWIDASCVEEAWPLAPPTSTDLGWVRNIQTKGAVWELITPLRDYCKFQRRAIEYQREYKAALVVVGLEGLPAGFAILCEVDEHSTGDTNPYHQVLLALAQLLAVESTGANTFLFLSFIVKLCVPFQQLLKEKDPRALLVLAYWYAKVRGSAWWIERRSVLECQAICLYLERYHAHETAILELLSFPKMRCGLVD